LGVLGVVTDRPDVAVQVRNSMVASVRRNLTVPQQPPVVNRSGACTLESGGMWYHAALWSICASILGARLVM